MRYSHLIVRNPRWDEKMSRVVMSDFWERGGEWMDLLCGLGEYYIISLFFVADQGKRMDLLCGLKETNLKSPKKIEVYL